MQDVWYQAPDWVTTNPLALAALGLIGGALVATVLMRLQRRARADLDRRLAHVDKVSLESINLSQLQVVGFGGFMLVVMCALVAIVLPAVGISLAAGCGVGTLIALVMIATRRRHGPLGSSSQGPGANTTLNLADRPPENASEK